MKTYASASSSHAAPVLFVKKKDSSLQLCVNYQGLNKISKKDRYLSRLVLPGLLRVMGSKGISANRLGGH